MKPPNIIHSIGISKNVSSNNVRASSSQMELDEALKILNVTKDTPKEEMAQVHLLALRSLPFDPFVEVSKDI